MRTPIKHFLFLIIACLWLTAADSFAAENSLGLDDSNHYDIYVAGYGDALAVLRDVDIISIKTIANETFVLVRTDTFNAKRSEGLVAFSAIRAILPTNRSTLQIIQPGIVTSLKKNQYFPADGQ